MIHLMAQKLPIPARRDKIWLPVNFATVAAHRRLHFIHKNYQPVHDVGTVTILWHESAERLDIGVFLIENLGAAEENILSFFLESSEKLHGVWSDIQHGVDFSYRKEEIRRNLWRPVQGQLSHAYWVTNLRTLNISWRVLFVFFITISLADLSLVLCLKNMFRNTSLTIPWIVICPDTSPGSSSINLNVISCGMSEFEA